MAFLLPGDGRRVPGAEQGPDVRVPVPRKDQGQGEGRDDHLLLDRPSRGLHHEDGRPDDASTTTATTAAATTIHSATAPAAPTGHLAAATPDLVSEFDERELPK